MMQSADEGPTTAVIFLDVDGVLSCNEHSQSATLEPAKMSRLAHIVERTDAKIVVSSNWRLYPELYYALLQSLTDCGACLPASLLSIAYKPPHPSRPLVPRY